MQLLIDALQQHLDAPHDVVFRRAGALQIFARCQSVLASLGEAVGVAQVDGQIEARVSRGAVIFAEVVVADRLAIVRKARSKSPTAWLMCPNSS